MGEALFTAARTGDTARLNAILEQSGVTLSPLDTDEAGRTAIFYSQLSGHAEATQLLEEHGWKPMDKANLFAGPGGRLCFWSDPSGVRVRQLRPREPTPMVNWAVKRPVVVQATAQAARQVADRRKREPLSHKKAAVAFRKKMRAAEYHLLVRTGSMAISGADHPMYPRRVYGGGRSRRGCAKPSLRRVREGEDEREEELQLWEEAAAAAAEQDDEDEDHEAVPPAPVPVLRTGVSEVLASVQVSEHRSAAGGGELWEMVPMMRRESSSSSSWLEVELEEGEQEQEEEGSIQLPAF